MVVKRFDIFLVQLDPTIGREIKKTRPCVVVSPDDMNEALNTVIIAPLTSTIRNYPTRINCLVNNREGQIATDQIRMIDKTRIKKKVGLLDLKTGKKVLLKLTEIFEY